MDSNSLILCCEYSLSNCFVWFFSLIILTQLRQLGPQSDVSLIRSGQNTLEVDAHVRTNSLSTGELTVGGMSIMEVVQKLLESGKLDGLIEARVQKILKAKNI